MSRKEEGFDFWLYRNKFAPKEFLEYVVTLSHRTRKPINMLLVSCETNLFDELENWQPELFDVI